MNRLVYIIFFIVFVSCTSSDDTNTPQTDQTQKNTVVLHFDNTFKEQTLVLGTKNDPNASVNVSAVGQRHQFEEVKYIVSNFRLVTRQGKEVPYFVDNLDKGASIVDHARPLTHTFYLQDIPAGEYTQIKFGMGIKTALNTLDQEKFPLFYAKADAYEAQMMWYWGKGYRFLKIEGVYGEYQQQLSIHTGSTLIDNTGDGDSAYVQGVDAYLEFCLDLPTAALVGAESPQINLRADFDQLLSGQAHKLTLVSGQGQYSNATPNTHTSDQMVKFLDNLGSNQKGLFSVVSVEN